MSIKINPNTIYRIMSVWTGQVLARHDNYLISQLEPKLYNPDPGKVEQWIFEPTGKPDEYIIRSTYQGMGKLVIKAPSNTRDPITFGKQEGNDNEIWKIATPDDIGAYLISKHREYHHEIALENNNATAQICLGEHESFYTHRWYLLPMGEWADDKKDNT